MIIRSFRAYFLVFVTLLLISCGGGSTVTSVTLSSDPADVPVGGRTTLTAEATNSVTGDALGEKVTFTIRHNESGSHLDVVNDRLDANNQARAIFHAGSKSGTDIVEASFASGARATTTIKVGDGVVIGDIRLEAFSQSGGGVSQAWRIRATVTDTRGFPAPGINVLFSTNNGDLGLTGVTTNSAGIAETILTLADSTQGARVWATAGGISVSTSVGPRN
ncbi:Ig-like domain-containing protein [Desulfonatronum lacustre]|uniref:Ig-like domain-containing protein n=1 Tax=Desulfonatronum lacustre TaxID=66849 RepID=UPI00048AC6B0|nr:Ig-like domain-containing protein [Desulfonatronum lacustre]